MFSYLALMSICNLKYPNSAKCSHSSGQHRYSNRQNEPISKPKPGDGNNEAKQPNCCKWRVKARSRSTQTPLRVNKDTPEVIQPVKNWIICTLQYPLKSSKSSATLYATNEGWPTSPTRKSETAKQNNKAKDGVWSSRIFQITSMTMKFLSNAVRAKRELTTHTHR